MGGKSSKTEYKSFYEKVDFIASSYILSLNFENLKKLSEPDYCENLITLTKDIFNKNFNELEIDYLAERVKNGQSENKMDKEKIYFLNKTNLDNLQPNKNNKSRLCFGIAKFYILIANLFSAIITTINPIYSFQNENGELIETNWEGTNIIPENAKVINYNICDERIRALTIQNGVSGVCSLNKKENLSQEPGIQELSMLYFDIYDFKEGKFVGMSKESMEDYKKDLEIFYKAFTGEDKMPKEIQSFNDIKMKKFEKCDLLNKPIEFSKEDEIFENYAKHVQKMVQNAYNKQQELEKILNEIFLIEKSEVRIHPSLNNTKLKQIIKKTRKIIVELYANCESDYEETVHILEALTELKTVKTLNRQINNLKNDKKEIVQSL
jgi:hypothetical protein